MLVQRAPDGSGVAGIATSVTPSGEKRVEDCVHDRRRRGDGAAFADTLGAERVCRARDRAEIDRDPAAMCRPRDGVIRQCSGQQLAAVGAIDDVLGKRLADALYDAAHNLTLRQ